MKSVKLISVALLMGMPVFGQVINEGFESGNLQGWQINSINCGVVSSDEVSSNTGSFCGYICENGGAFEQKISVVEDAEYTLLFFAKNSSVLNSDIKLQIFDVSHSDNLIEEKDVLSNDYWTENRLSVEIPSGTSLLRLKWLKGADDNMFYLDDVAFGVNTDVLTGSTKGRISLFPNPTAGNFRIKSPEPVKKCSLFSLKGEKIKEADVPEEKNVFVNFSDVSPGVYLLKIGTAHNVSIVKLNIVR
ncbi:MAG: T9SS type A sorting domain-containing protein [Chlorobi bacterium]|nr:T9SS type A sorting domain-containing protein [Chlorobiota bacterium]